MRIAIYHNLEKGGALNSLIHPLKFIHKNNTVDIFSFKENIPKNLTNKIYLYKISTTKNIFQSIFQILFELKKINQKIAIDINNGNYDLIIIFPCIITQSPYVLRYLKQKNKSIYFFTEPKREFYEKTSFNHWSPKKIFTRIIRLPIKYIDKKNCRHAKNIISNSIYTSNKLKQIYGKTSTVIYPGLKPIKPKKIIINNNKKILSVGQISKIKGHDFSIKQVSGISDKITILGRETVESKKIYKISTKNKVVLNIIKTENDSFKDDIYNHFSIYLANNLYEPFGITTLEATSHNCLVLGKNEGGTPEIIKNGKNGYLYNSIKEARSILKNVLKRDKIVIYQINTIDWKFTSKKIMQFYKKHINHDQK